VDKVEELGGDALFISLTPAASHRLHRSRLPHKNLLSYAGGEDAYRTGLDNFGRMERIFEAIDPKLMELHGIPSLEPARYAVYNLKILLDVLSSSMAITRRIIDRERPGSILIPDRRIPGAEKRLYAFSNEESVFSTVLSFDDWGVPVRFLEPGTATSLPKVHARSGGSSLRARLRWRIRSSASLLNAGLLAKQQDLLPAMWAFFGGFLRRRSGGPVLIYGSGYSWDDALVELYRDGWGPVHRTGDKTAQNPSSFPHLQDTVRDVLDSHPSLLEFAEFPSIDYRPFLTERIGALISESVTESIESYRRIRDMISGKGIRALLISTQERPAGHAAVRAARDAGIPVISWQHGGSGYAFHPMMPYIECINTDLHLVFGTPVAEKYSEAMEWLGWKDRPSIMAVGSSSLDRMRARLSRDRDKGDDGPVLYITTAYLQNIFHISQPFDAIGWDEHLWQVQKRVIDLAGRFPDREFIIKLHPTHRSGEPLGSYILDSDISNIRCISNEAKLEDLLPRSSIILFDLVSTGILQALLTVKPIFLYSGLYQLDETASTLLQKRAVVSANLDEFVGTVAEYLDGNVRNKDSLAHSLDFIKAYGLHEADSMSAKRAVSLVGRVEKDFPVRLLKDGGSGAWERP
jgi:hypothetical protein